MNNFEKIKAMSIDEMAEWLKESRFCESCLDDDKCIHSDKCLKGVKQWLEQESEEERRGTMTKLKWICIAIFFIFVIVFITSFIPDTSIRHGISSLSGLIIGFVCMNKYLSEAK